MSTTAARAGVSPPRVGLDVELVRIEQEGTSPRRRRTRRTVLTAVRQLAVRRGADRNLALRLAGD